MSRARHMKKDGGMTCRASGGRIEEAGGNKTVMDAAKSSKDTMAYKDGGCVDGGMSRMRLDRPGRKVGGRVFSNPLSASSATAPMSSASKGGK
ncbi:MAG TPA: hypothetical protein VI358_18055 [Pseudolabrys sp.]